MWWSHFSSTLTRRSPTWPSVISKLLHKLNRRSASWKESHRNTKKYSVNWKRGSFWFWEIVLSIRMTFLKTSCQNSISQDLKKTRLILRCLRSIGKMTRTMLALTIQDTSTAIEKNSILSDSYSQNSRVSWATKFLKSFCKTQRTKSLSLFSSKWRRSKTNSTKKKST